MPEEIYDTPIKTGNGRHLPYRLFDQYRTERTPKTVPTLELSDGSGLVASFTPQCKL